MNQNKQSATSFLTMIVAGNIDEAYAQYVDMSGTHHNIFTPAGFAALRDGMKEAHIKFPHKQYALLHAIADEDMVAVHSRMTLEEGKPTMSVVHLFRFKDGKIVEMWDVGQPILDNSINKNGAL